MLVLTRRIGERITIGTNISVAFLDIQGQQVRIGIEAPREISVHREEVYRRLEAAACNPPESNS
jgi:carbon storage regulator